MERAGRIVLIAGLAVAGAAAGLVWSRRAPGRRAAAAPVPGEADTLAVEVLNGTSIDGLAREVTRRLRRAGIDVVFYGSARDSTLGETTIVVRRGDSTSVRKLRQVLGVGRVVLAPDPRLLLDASVLVGSDLARALGLHP